MISPHARAEINTDGQLCARVRDGDSLALGVLFDRYQRAVYLAIQRANVLRRGEIADDYLALAFEQFRRVAMFFRPGRGMNFLSFVMRYLYRYIIDAAHAERGAARVSVKAHRQGVRARSVPISVGARHAVRGEVPETQLPASMPIEPADGRVINHALAELPERDRFVLLSRIRGRTLGEIGTELGISRSRVGQLEAAALATLRQRLQGTAA